MDLVTCQHCGMKDLVPGVPCWNCQHYPDDPSPAAADRSTTRSSGSDGGVVPDAIRLDALTYKAQLRIEGTDVVWSLNEGERIGLGRMSAVDRIGSALNPHHRVSRYHATVMLRGRRIEITDTSKHGTKINGETLAGTKTYDLPVTIVLADVCTVIVGSSK